MAKILNDIQGEAETEALLDTLANTLPEIEGDNIFRDSGLFGGRGTFQHDA